MPTPTSPGEAIRLARLICHMGQEHLALAAGVSERTVRRVEKGEAISAESMRSICATLQIDARTVRNGRSLPGKPRAPDVPAVDTREGPRRPFECPWDTDGGLSLPLADGSAWSYVPGSQVQDCCIDLVVGRPGTGKSTLLHGASLALCGLDPDTGDGDLRRTLPRIVSLDAGPTALAWAERVRSLLPDHRRHEVMTLRLSNAADEAINPFETPLGWRRPGNSHRSHLLHLLCALTACEMMPDEGFAYLAAAVDAAYRQPAAYETGRNDRVDRLVSDLFQVPPKTWWEVVDRLFEHGFMHEARIAHGEAVPNLLRFLQVLMEIDPYDPWDEVFERKTTKIVLSQVMRALQDFPVLTGPTALRFGEARIVAVDMEAVLPPGPGPAERQSTVMYLVARFLARDLFDSKDDLGTLDRSFLGFPEVYRSYHESRIREIRARPRRLVLDEVHRVSSRGLAMAQVALDVRDGRKWGVQVAVGSQVAPDIDGAVVDMATGLFLLGDGEAPRPTYRNDTERTFGLTENESAALSDGNSVAVFYTKAGRISTPFLPLRMRASGTG